MNDDDGVAYVRFDTADGARIACAACAEVAGAAVERVVLGPDAERR